MNKHFPKPLAAELSLALFIVAVAGVITSCATVDRTLYREQVTPASTNAVTGEVTPARTNLAPNPNVETGIAVVGAVPTPYTQIGAAAAAILYGAYMTFRNNRNKKTATALAKGVDTYRDALSAKDKEAFTVILKNEQEAVGVRPEVSKILETIRK